MLTDPKSIVLKFIGFRPTGDFGPLTGYTSRHGRSVWYMKAPPKTPPTGWQRQQRARFSGAAHLWTALTANQRTDWLAAARKARLNITGYDLWVWFQLTRDRPIIRTVERQSGIQLLH